MLAGVSEVMRTREGKGRQRHVWRVAFSFCELWWVKPSTRFLIYVGAASRAEDGVDEVAAGISCR